jgi:hypothetical protein
MSDASGNHAAAIHRSTTMATTETVLRYRVKFPRLPFDRAWSLRTRDLATAVQRVERRHRNSRELYIQLVEETDDAYRVVAEYQPRRGWLGPLQAAGFAPVPGEWQ